MNTTLKNPLPIDGVYTQVLTPHTDDRGTFIEIHRASWISGYSFPQWNYVQSKSDIFRGVHLHIHHADCIMALSGSIFIGLKDLRPNSPTYLQVAHITFTTPDRFLFIPPGVAHGFYFELPTSYIYAVSSYFDMTDELGCHWLDTKLGIPWPRTDATISTRDANLPSFDTLIAESAPLLQ